MRIADSTVNLVSERRYQETFSISHEKSVFASIMGTEAPNFKKALGLKKSKDDEDKKNQDVQDIDNKKEKTLFTNYNADGEFAVQENMPLLNKVSEIENIRMQIMERLLNIMQILYGNTRGAGKMRMQEYMRSLSTQMNQGSYQWMSVSTTTYIHTEVEQTAFQAQGIAKTDDGREINFGVNINMTRQFTEAIGVMNISPVQLIDPLVINVGSGVTEISDQTFSFDLDADGTEEEVKNIAPGSGFLAYDRNGDGIINDGSELFGTRSGNGFADLAELNSDNNDWIDENDDIYEKLRVWCRGEDGKDTLMTLKEADVGAIYLGHADTRFTSQGSDFMVNAQFKSSGIFLRESTGEAGSVHQIDLAKMA